MKKILLVLVMTMGSVFFAAPSYAADDAAPGDTSSVVADKKDDKDAEKAADQAAKDAEKAAKDAEKAAADQAAKDAADQAAKDAEKAADQAAKDAEKAAKDAEKADAKDDPGPPPKDDAPKVEICHPVNGKGELGNGWNLIPPNQASSHLDDDGNPKHTSKDGLRSDQPAVDGTCPGAPIETEDEGIEICHPVNGKGELGNGWNLISPDQASSHIDDEGNPKHTSSDGRVDIPAVNGTCPGDQLVEIPFPTPEVNDPCGPANATWVQPADTDQVTWFISDAGNLIGETKPGFVWPSGQTINGFGTAPDSGDACPPSVVTLVYPTPDVLDPCGPGNATWVQPADTDQVTWFISDAGNLIGTTLAGFVWPSGLTVNGFGTAADSGIACLPPVDVCPDIEGDQPEGTVCSGVLPEVEEEDPNDSGVRDSSVAVRRDEALLPDTGGVPLWWLLMGGSLAAAGVLVLVSNRPVAHAFSAGTGGVTYALALPPKVAPAPVVGREHGVRAAFRTVVSAVRRLLGGGR